MGCSPPRGLQSRSASPERYPGERASPGLSAHNRAVEDICRTIAAREGKGASGEHENERMDTRLVRGGGKDNMYLLDWGKQIFPRSEGETIPGDMYPHWGVAARLLSVQMITHAMNIIFPPESDVPY